MNLSGIVIQIIVTASLRTLSASPGRNRRLKEFLEEANMRNKLIDLNNHLFAQLERLSDEEAPPEKIKEEINRAKAVTGVANQIINNARLLLDATKAISDGLIRESEQGKYMLGMLEEPKNSK